MTMKKALVALVGVFSLTLAFAGSTVFACDGDGKCACQHGKQKAAAAKAVKTSTVSLQGRVVSFGCQMEADRQECTGAALVVGDKKHLIKKAGKGAELVSKSKDDDKVVKVSGK
jgi:hypothetical protein